MKFFLTLYTIAAGLLLLQAVWRDVATRSIPDIISVLLVILGLLHRASEAWTAALESLAAASVLFLILALAHARGLLGGGDVKLISAFACGLPLASLYPFLFVTTMAGGLLGCLHLLARTGLKHEPIRPPLPRGASLAGRVIRVERRRIARRGPLPYGVAIACGGLFVLAQRMTG